MPARQAEFTGVIQPGCEYVLVDDFVGMGGTLANLKGYIESRGSKVLAAVTLRGKPHSAKLAFSPERLNELTRYLARTEAIGTIRNRNC